MSQSARVLAKAMLPVVFLAAILVVFWWQLTLIGDSYVDDAYITFSFSKNLALGNGPVYSHGMRVEGYSNFLWMLLVAIPLSLAPTVDPLLIARVLVVPFACLLGWATYSLIRLPCKTGRAPRVVGWVGVLLLVFDTDLVLAGVAGLETLPHVALLTAGFAFYFKRRVDAKPGQDWTIPCLVASALMRIDGFAPLLGILGWELGRRIIKRKPDLKGFVRWAAPGVVVYLLWFAWRWHYYGMPLPNTYYAKALLPHALPNRGWEYTRDFWSSTGLFAAAPFALFALWGARDKALLLVAFVLAHSMYVVRAGGDWMPFWRFYAIVVPVTLVLIAWGILTIVRVAMLWRTEAVEAAAAFSVLATLWFAHRLDDHYVADQVKRNKLWFSGTLGPMMREHYRPMCRLLNYVVPAGKRLVSDYAGVMAYYTDAVVIDMWGLANADIGQRGTTEGVAPIWGRTCPACYATLAPDFFHVQWMKPREEYHTHSEVVAAVWQSDTIGKYVDFNQFAAGRATDLRLNRSIFFLERRQPGASFAARSPTPGVLIDYPFEARHP